MIDTSATSRNAELANPPAGAARSRDGCPMISQGMTRILAPDTQHSAARFALVFKKSLISCRAG